MELVVKNRLANEGDPRVVGSILGLGRFSGKGLAKARRRLALLRVLGDLASAASPPAPDPPVPAIREKQKQSSTERFLSETRQKEGPGAGWGLPRACSPDVWESTDPWVPPPHRI